jgi:hypothetical protein
MRAQGPKYLSGRVKGLQRAIRLGTFKLAQRQRMGLAAYLRHLEEPKRNDVAQLFEVSGLWIRNVGDRHNTKRQTLWIIRRIMPWL